MDDTTFDKLRDQIHETEHALGISYGSTSVDTVMLLPVERLILTNQLRTMKALVKMEHSISGLYRTLGS